MSPIHPSTTLTNSAGRKLAKINTQLDYILLDGSGSMSGERWWHCLEAIDAYVDGLKTANIHSQIMLHTFDSRDPDCLQRDLPIADWRPLLQSPIGAHWTSTPLYDAIQLMGRRLRDLDPPRASLIIATDGGENKSRFTTEDQARAILNWCRAKGWQVTFIGAEFNNDHLARTLGAKGNEAIGVQQRLLAEAAKELAKKRARYATTGAPMHWSDDEKQQFGGYLASPSTQ